MASLYKRGRRYWIGYSVNGRRVDRSLLTTNLRVTRDKKRKIEYELAIGDLRQASKIQLVPILKAFCEHLQETRTHKSYKNDFSRLRVEDGFGQLHLALPVGQAATTLSGGEAQRVKLSRELSKKGTGRTIYILDEPTTGLHADDILKLLNVLNKLVDGGNTVIVIEHNMDVIKTADYIIDLGPEGGDEGGAIVGCGTPEEIVQTPNSYTGEFLKRILPIIRD